MSKAIEYLTKYPLSWKDLEALTEDEKAALSVVNYAVSEINALQRMYIFSAHRVEGDDDIIAAVSIQRFVLLRSWSARLFEFQKFLSFGGTKKITNDRKLLDLAEEGLKEFEPLKQKEGFHLVRSIRNEAANHYSFHAAKKNLPHTSANANCSLFMHKMNGNSYYPMGEEVMFIGRMNRHGELNNTKEERIKIINIWMEWNLEASRWLVGVHYSFIKQLVLDRFPDKAATKRDYWIDPKLVGTRDSRRVPLFLRMEEKYE